MSYENEGTESPDELLPCSPQTFPADSLLLLDSSGRWRQYPRQVTNLMLTCLIIARFTRSSHNHGQSTSLSNRFELTT